MYSYILEGLGFQKSGSQISVKLQSYYTEAKENRVKMLISKLCFVNVILMHRMEEITQKESQGLGKFQMVRSWYMEYWNVEEKGKKNLYH